MSGPQETCTMRLLKVKESHVHAIPTHFVSRPAMRNFTRRISHRYTCKQGHTEACVLTPGEALDALLWHVVPNKLARALSLSLFLPLPLSPSISSLGCRNPRSLHSPSSCPLSRLEHVAHMCSPLETLCKLQNFPHTRAEQ